MIILTEKTIYLTENFFNFTTFVIISGIAACIGLIVGLWVTRPEGGAKMKTFDRSLISFLMAFLFSGVGLLIGAIVGQKTETIAERTEYEIYLEDMTYNELAKSSEYTIVSVEGKKIIIVDKEW